MRLLLITLSFLVLTACDDGGLFDVEKVDTNHGYGYEYDWMSPTYKFKVRGDFVPTSDHRLIDFELWYERVNKCLGQESEPFPDLYIVFVDDLIIDGVQYAGRAHEYPPLILIDRENTWDWYMPVVGQHELAHILSGEYHHNGVVVACGEYGQQGGNPTALGSNASNLSDDYESYTP